ncbi:MAG: O-antigen ligase family protein [Flavobacteriales bacterium]
MMNGLSNKFPTILSGFLLFASLCLPAINLGNQLPSIHWVDIFFPVLVIFIGLNWPKLKRSTFHFLPFVMAGFVYFTTAIQGHSSTISDYFEIYKWLKIGVLLIFLGLIDFSQLKKYLPYLFLLLVVLNLLHFYNFPGINQLLEEHYNGGLQIQFFGKNSLGEPAVKRMVGTMGNPNINALLFIFFSILFLPKQFNKKQFGLFFIAMTMVFLCQSRTSIIVVLLLFLFTGIFHSKIWTRKQWLIVITGLILSYLLALMLATSFFKYSAYSSSLLDGTALYSGSVRGRFETWALLGQQILEYPIFGHGPYKNYFYANRLYSENEYILMTWRYGLFGLLIYILIYFIPFIQLYRTKSTCYLPFILVILLMSISALTNNPLTERNIELLFCLALAWAFERLMTTDARFNT